LIGYDHETDSDWEVMTKKENEVIAQLQAASANSKQIDNTVA
jgi:ssRNA-specific RNase YbeY (16S rRNA maturation enzyme)